MKIGVLTFWRLKNYGTILQCYALQKYLYDRGHDAYLIRYYFQDNSPKTNINKLLIKALDPVKLLVFLKYKILNSIENKRNLRRAFDSFFKRYIKQSEKIYCSYNELKENPPDADVYIVGSDQIWKFKDISIDKLKARLHVCFLDFGKIETKRISYAPSFGKEKLDDSLVKEITPLLERFNYVSVREKSGLDICKQCGINNAEWVPDPTILLDINIYRSLYSDLQINLPDKAYCFLYLLDNRIDFSVQAIFDWIKKENLDVVYITGNNRKDKYKKIYATIPEWIYLLEHAEYVITNSYHCCIFSVLFKKKFGVRPHAGRKIGENIRLDSLFELFQIERRYINSDLSVVKRDINWQSVSNILQNIRNDCKLPNIINGM